MGDVSNTVWCSCVALNDDIALFLLVLSLVSKCTLVLSVSSLVDLLLSLNLLGNEEEEKCWLPCWLPCCMGANKLLSGNRSRTAFRAASMLPGVFPGKYFLPANLRG